MKLNLALLLEQIDQKIEYAFQPIVDIHSGVTYGSEALLRGPAMLGFETIQALFDYAFSNNIIHQVDIALRRKALSAFANLKNSANYRLFFNMDGRVFESPDYHPNKTAQLLRDLNLPSDSFCLEMSELYNNSEAKHIREILTKCRQQNFRLALDDYGRGFSELKMLYEYQPDYLKIDRFFIDGVSEDQKKRLLVSNMVNMSHALGILVIAEGVEREQDFHTCRELGCDLVQGYLISRPQLNHARLRNYYPTITSLNNDNRRHNSKDLKPLENHLDFYPSVKENDEIQEVLELFKNNPDRTFFPVVDEKGEARGILRESVLKNYIYNRFGHALLNNRAIGKKVVHFMTRSAIADENHSLDEILHIYATNDVHEGILINRNFKYHGFLSNQSLLHILNEKRLAQAQDQNPLTKLPGNNSITESIIRLVSQPRKCTSTIAYFDFNNFKPFNDQYGFRQGDRAILLFSELLKREIGNKGYFVGHVGGDDFFCAISETDANTAQNIILKTIHQFAIDVESFYSSEDRLRGSSLSKDRDGSLMKYPILTCCAAILHIETDIGIDQLEKVGEKLAYLKKQAKLASNLVAVDSLGESRNSPHPPNNNVIQLDRLAGDA